MGLPGSTAGVDQTIDELLRAATAAVAAAVDAGAAGTDESGAAAAIGAVLAQERPSDAVVMEGHAPMPASDGSTVRWVVDPVDGSVNARRGLGSSAVSVAAFHAGRPVAGAVADLRSGATFTAAAGRGTWDDSGCRRTARPSCADVGEMVISLGWTFARRDRPAELAITGPLLEQAYDVRRSGCPALNLVSVASGGLDAVVAFDLRCWDFAAGLLLVHEAGGALEFASFPGTPSHALLAGPPGTIEVVREQLAAAARPGLPR